MLNQLDNLTERVRGSNKLVDRWLHVRKHLLVAYYNLVGIKPGKESYMNPAGRVVGATVNIGQAFPAVFAI